jgi:hypothetical protein
MNDNPIQSEQPTDWNDQTLRLIMPLCPICGNKRCPKAENDQFKCTNSNAVGQIGELEHK